MDGEQWEEIINYEIFVGIIQLWNDESNYFYLFFLRNGVLPVPMTWLVFFLLMPYILSVNPINRKSNENPDVG